MEAPNLGEILRAFGDNCREGSRATDVLAAIRRAIRAPKARKKKGRK